MTRLLLLYNRLKDQADRLEAGSSRFARQAFGRTTAVELRCASFVLVEAPGAAVKEHISRREPPPALVDELITKTYYAFVPRKQ